MLEKKSGLELTPIYFADDLVCVLLLVNTIFQSLDMLLLLEDYVYFYIGS